MIQVTLTFQSYDAAVAALARFKETPADVVIEAPGKQAKAAKADKLTEEKFDPNSDKTQVIPREVIEEAKKAAAQTPASKPSSPEPSKSAEPAAASPATEALTYEAHVKPLVIKAGGVKGRDAVVALLGTFGVAKGPDLKPEQLPAVKAGLEALIAE